MCPDTEKPKKLYTEVTLKSHKESVHEKSIICPKCGYAIEDTHKLIDHFRDKHLNYKQYKCNTCDAQFVWVKNAKQHYQAVHLKNMNRKLDLEYFQKNKHLIENRKHTDPNYPTNDMIREKLNEEKKKPGRNAFHMTTT